MRTYFCKPRSPWQRGTNENGNALLRQYFPRGISFDKITEETLQKVANRLNNRPVNVYTTRLRLKFSIAPSLVHLQLECTQLFTRAVDEVRRAEAKAAKLPRATRRATLKNADGPLTEQQVKALVELMSMDLQTARAWRIKEMLRWVRKATSMRGAGWRLSSFINVALQLVADIDLLKPVRRALENSGEASQSHPGALGIGPQQCQPEAFNGLFQAAKCRARGYRNDHTFISMIYLLAAPIQNLLKST